MTKRYLEDATMQKGLSLLNNKTRSISRANSIFISRLTDLVVISPFRLKKAGSKQISSEDNETCCFALDAQYFGIQTDNFSATLDRGNVWHVHSSIYGLVMQLWIL